MIDRTMIREAVAALVERAAAFLPRLLLGLVVVAVGWLLARLLARLARRLSVRFGLDRASQVGGLEARLAEAGVRVPASRLLERLLFWFVFLVFVALALPQLGLDLSALPVAPILEYLPRALAAIVLLTAGVYLAGVGGRAVQTGAAGLGVEFHRSLGRATQLALIAVVVVLTIDQLGFDVALLTGLLTGVAMIGMATVGLTFALGARGAARNLVSGFYVKENLRTGQRVVFDGEEGTVEAIGSVYSEVDVGTHILLVPNASLLEGTVRVRKES